MQRSVATALQPLLRSLQPLGELLGSLKGLTSSVSMSVRGAVKDVIDAAVTSADDKWAPRLGKPRVTIDTKPADANFEPKPWDTEIKEKTPAFF